MQDPIETQLLAVFDRIKTMMYHYD
jgi:hypothetical protein